MDKSEIPIHLRKIMKVSDANVYFQGLLFYKYLSDQLKSYFNTIIEKEDLILSEAYQKNYKQFKEDALSQFGYFIDYDKLYENILFNDESVLNNLEEALNQIATSSKDLDSETIFYHVFDDINLSNSNLGKNDTEKESNLISILDLINLLSKDYSIVELFDESLKLVDSSKFVNREEYINELLSRIAISNNKEASTIYDPFMGGAMTILNLYNHLNEPTIYAQEINLATYNLAIMNLIIHDVNYKKINVFLDDTITNPGFLGELFDIIISIPPFGAKHDLTNIKGAERFSNLKLNKKIIRSEFFYIMHMLYYLNKDGVIATIVPSGVLFRGTDINMKEKIIKENNYLDAVINLPSNIFNGTGVNTVLLVFRKNKNNNDVLFIDASKEYESQRRVNILKEEHIDKIVKTYTSKVEIDKFSKLVDISEISENDFNLSISRYIDTYEGEYVELEDVILKQIRLNMELASVDLKIGELMYKIEIN